MGKGSGACARTGLELEDKSNPVGEAALALSDQQASQLDYSLSTIVNSWSGAKWYSADGKVSFFQDEAGWSVYSGEADIEEAMKEIGLVEENDFKLTFVRFPSLKEARQAIEECAKEADISLDNHLTRHGLTEYQIGSFPLRTRKVYMGCWRIEYIGTLPASLEPFFPGGAEEFALKCREAKLVGVDGKRWATRTQAVQAVRSFVQGLT
jgi:hypothetical protein